MRSTRGDEENSVSVVVGTVKDVFRRWGSTVGREVKHSRAWTGGVRNESPRARPPRSGYGTHKNTSYFVILLFFFTNEIKKRGSTQSKVPLDVRDSRRCKPCILL